MESGDKVPEVNIVLNGENMKNLLSFNAQNHLPEGRMDEQTCPMSEARWEHLQLCGDIIEKLNWFKYNTLAPTELLPIKGDDEERASFRVPANLSTRTRPNSWSRWRTTPSSCSTSSCSALFTAGRTSTQPPRGWRCSGFCAA